MPRAPGRAASRRVARGAAAACALLAAACAGSPPGDAGDAAPVVDGAEDAAHLDDAPGGDAGGDAGGDVSRSSCPPPPRVTPADLMGRGYLAPAVVTYLRTVDGDTAHFGFPGTGDRTVRFLFVNTEETRGAEMTAFGVATSNVVQGYLRAARETVVVVREEPSRPGTPDLDPFGRWLALIFLDGELLQTRIIREGLSAYYTQFGCAPGPVHTALLYAEAEANAARLGIWAEGHPTDYRPVLETWIRGGRNCRPNPFLGPYCR